MNGPSILIPAASAPGSSRAISPASRCRFESICSRGAATTVGKNEVTPRSARIVLIDSIGFGERSTEEASNPPAPWM